MAITVSCRNRNQGTDVPRSPDERNLLRKTKSQSFAVQSSTEPHVLDRFPCPVTLKGLRGVGGDDDVAVFKDNQDVAAAGVVGALAF